MATFGSFALLIALVLAAYNLLAGAVAANEKGQLAHAVIAAVVAQGDLSQRLALGHVDVAPVAHNAVHDVSGEDEQQAEVNDVNGQDGKALLLGKQTALALFAHAMRPEAEAGEDALGRLQGGAFIADRKLDRLRDAGADVRSGKANRLGIHFPGIRPAVQRDEDQADADQAQQRQEPPGVVDIGETEAVQPRQSLRCIRALHRIRIGRRALQNDGADGGKQAHDNNEKNTRSHRGERLIQLRPE